jgi:HAD superfamily hydrolase (TIGR01509 family)
VNTSELEAPSALLWDMDGTIVDSEDYWIAAEIELAEAHGATWTHEDGLRQVGQGLPLTAAALQRVGVEASIEGIIEFLASRVGGLLKVEIPWRPGAVELMQEAHQAGIPMALVTMSITSIAEIVASRVPGASFDVVITGDRVPHQKPHPIAYLMAAERLGFAPEDCLAIEDSPSGMTSAHDAGVALIGVRHLVPLDESLGTAIWDSLAGKTLADVNEVFALHKARA